MSGTVFRRDQLIAEVDGVFNQRITALEEAARAKEAQTDAERVDAWRTASRESVFAFAARLKAGEVSDIELSRYEVPRMPSIGRYSDNGSEERRQVERLQVARDRALAYARALAPDPVRGEPFVEVRTPDLRRIGYPS